MVGGYGLALATAVVAVVKDERRENLGADEDAAGVGVTGHTVVEMGMMEVLTTVEWAGQFVISGAQDVMVTRVVL